MTHRRELEDLQRKARKAGRVCNFFIEAGSITGVFYQSRPNTNGRVMDLLSFAEIERAKPHWYELSTN
jgi:hypothetical protein